jgi:hypothetical protein
LTPEEFRECLTGKPSFGNTTALVAERSGEGRQSAGGDITAEQFAHILRHGSPIDGSAVRDGVLQEYDPDQPRDWHGRWTDGGSGGPPPTGSVNPSGLAPRTINTPQGTVTFWDEIDRVNYYTNKDGVRGHIDAKGNFVPNSEINNCDDITTDQANGIVEKAEGSGAVDLWFQSDYFWQTGPDSGKPSPSGWFTAGSHDDNVPAEKVAATGKTNNSYVCGKLEEALNYIRAVRAAGRKVAGVEFLGHADHGQGITLGSKSHAELGKGHDVQYFVDEHTAEEFGRQVKADAPDLRMIVLNACHLGNSGYLKGSICQKVANAAKVPVLAPLGFGNRGNLQPGGGAKVFENAGGMTIYGELADEIGKINANTNLTPAQKKAQIGAVNDRGARLRASQKDTWVVIYPK